ncbi:MAG: Ku protein [Xanthobacteraceae bacterium]|jgi:DNA end-binding protein Ku
MAPRPNWKGYLKLSLVSCSVALYSATTTSERIRFNILNKKTGNRVRNLVIDSETEEPVEQEDRVKGYQFEKGQYVRVEDDELDEVALESTHTIDIESFVPRKEVDEIYLDESYYIAPTDKVAYEAFAVIRDAMAKEDLVGLARVVLYRRERILMLTPRGKGLMATALRYNSEVRAEDSYFDEIPSVKVPADMLELATHILKSKKAKFDPDKFEDRYESALSALIRAKQAGKPAPKASEPKPSNVVNLMDALRKSVSAEKGGKSASSRSTRAGHGRTTHARKRAASSRSKVKRAG